MNKKGVSKRVSLVGARVRVTYDCFSFYGFIIRHGGDTMFVVPDGCDENKRSIIEVNKQQVELI